MRLANNFKRSSRKNYLEKISFSDVLREKNYVSKNTKILAWAIFLYFFIENGTLGLVPKQFYFVYRNMRISDFLLYSLTIYSIYNTKEYIKLFNSRVMIIPKLILVYFFLQYIGSSIFYEYNIIEFFFRLKGIWMCLLIFPYLLLMKRGGLGYLFKLILPVAIVANILYIMSAVTGIAFMPDIGIADQSLPGGLKVYRVYGGTFYGEIFFMGFIYQWITKKFRLYQLFLVILFIIPHILAFGRSAWLFFILTISIMAIWYTLKKKEFRQALKQILLVSVMVSALFYTFTKFVPKSDYLVEAIEARVSQGKDDYKYNEGTYGTRLANIGVLFTLWQNSNIFVGIGMHPLWVVKPETVEESIYAWGFSDVGWASVLAAYGLIGFILAIMYQFYFFITSFKVIKNTKYNDILVYFVLVLISRLFFDSAVNTENVGLSVGLWGFWSTAFYVAALTYKVEYPDEDFKL